MGGSMQRGPEGFGSSMPPTGNVHGRLLLADVGIRRAKVEVEREGEQGSPPCEHAIADVKGGGVTAQTGMRSFVT